MAGLSVPYGTPVTPLLGAVYLAAEPEAGHAHNATDALNESQISHLCCELFRQRHCHRQQPRNRSDMREFNLSLLQR